jgi:hypothetical protein
VDLPANQYVLSQTDIKKDIVSGPIAVMIHWKHRLGEASDKSSRSCRVGGQDQIEQRGKFRCGYRPEKDQTRQSSLSRIMNAAKEFIPIVLAAFALEMVITISFNSLEGLFLIGSTLAAGTSVYVFDR